MNKLNVPTLASFPQFLKNIESKWKTKLTRRFERERYFGPKERLASGKPARYVLSMFPYPSGRLHLGHVRIYTSGDILARFSRLMSKNKNYTPDYSHVIYPMGFDSFGLPAENAALERGMSPETWTNSNIRTMKQQLDDLALQFDWREATSNPAFYKWTQELFLKLMDSGLVYKSYAQVNWDPVDKTVLADEQVDEEGRSWRSGAMVQRRFFRQWFIKVNSMTNAIYEAEDVDPETWRDILAIQRNWIGQPSGWLFYLPVTKGNSTSVDTMSVFTYNPEYFTLTSTKLVISENHWLEKVHKISDVGQITNPFTRSPMQVKLTNNLDELPPSTMATLANDSGALGTSDSNIRRDQVILHAKLNNLGGYFTSNRYRDWLISRQRFWGTPIPALRCDSCGSQGVSRESLPITLPKAPDFATLRSNLDSESDPNEAVAPLEKLAPKDWLYTKCPSCGLSAKRECETFDTLFDSSWYFLRYASQPTKEVPFDKNEAQPVWCYVGGKEHACMHLFYSRFITHFLHSIGELNFREPFRDLLVQGVVKSRTFKLDGKYITEEEAKSIKGNKNLVIEYEKMSKSKGNGVDPQDLLDTYGIDATRFCLMNYANPRSERLWRNNQEEFKDVLIFLRRVAMAVELYYNLGLSLTGKEKTRQKIKEFSKAELKMAQMNLIDLRNKCSVDAVFYIQEAHQFRQFISVMHVLTTGIRTYINTSSVYTKEFAETLATQIIMLNPIVPHLSEELWAHFCQSVINPLRNLKDTPYNISLQASDQPWPLPDQDYGSSKCFLMRNSTQHSESSLDISVR